MFQIDTFLEATLASVTNRVERHGEDEKPAVSLRLEITGANTLLDLIDPKIRESLYKPADSEDLPGVEPSTPVLRCNSFEKHTLPTCYEGWTLAVDDGIDAADPMVFGSSKIDKFVVEAKQGGSIVLGLRVGTSDVDAEKLGKLAMHNGQSIWVTLKAPEKKAEAIDGSQAAFDKDHPDAGTLFAAEHGSGPGDDGRDEGDDGSEGGDADARAAGAVQLSPEAAWPFPTGRKDTEVPPQSATTEGNASASARTARGRAKTKAHLAAERA
jgi:hypothetical protein